MSQLEIVPVNKYDSTWLPDTLFTGFNVRVILIKSNDLITNIQNLHQLSRRLKRELGQEGVDWILNENPHTDENELYLHNTNKLVMWRLQDNDKFIQLFRTIESHTTDESRIAEWHTEQAEKERAAEAEAVRAREEAIRAYIDANRPPDQMPDPE